MDTSSPDHALYTLSVIPAANWLDLNLSGPLLQSSDVCWSAVIRPLLWGMITKIEGLQRVDVLAMHTNKAQSGSIKVFNVDVSDGDNIVTVFDFLYSSTGMNICPKKSETVYPPIWGILKLSVLLKTASQYKGKYLCGAS